MRQYLVASCWANTTWREYMRNILNIGIEAFQFCILNFNG